jgi:2-polyprenyl-3-methyl-5-hydroxy-6-metoxy-1,4-benzoquinol methylase
MAAFHQQLDVLCVASTAEGGPLPLLEALACGAFVVTTDVGIAREVIRDRADGLMVERTPAAFAAALHWCEANVEWLRSTRSERAARLHAARSWERVIGARAEVLRTAYAATRAIERLQTSYRDHLQQVSGADENTFAAAAVYYRAELQALLPEARDARIVEVGCGFGHLLRFLAERGYRDLCGVDLDPDLAAATAQRLAGRATVHCADARAFLAAHEGRFDLVLAYDILEHFDLDGALAFATAARRALRPGGRAVFRTPNMANVLGCYSRYMDLTHRIGFTEQSARQLLLTAGFADVAVVAAQHEPGPLRDGIAASRALHEQLFAQQDRSRPTCFDKNLVVAAGVPVAGAPRSGVAAATGARA